MKLHPLSIPYRIARAIALSGYVIVPVAFAFGTGAGGIVAAYESVLDLLPASGALVAVVAGLSVFGVLGAIAGWQVAYYRRFEYALEDDVLDVDSGVLWRRDRAIPYGRIQSVSVSSNVVQRALGVAEVDVETAGDGWTEARLRCVSLEHAQWLREEVSRRKRRVPTESEGVDETVEKVFALRGRELAVLGLARFDDRAFVLLLSAFPVFLAGFVRLVVGPVSSTGLLAALFALGLTLTSAAVSTAYAVVGYYGFRLYRGDDELRYERGLLKRHSGTIPLSKVQAVTITENPLARAAGYASLTVETAGYSWEDAGTTTVAVPLATRERVVDIAHDVEPVYLSEFERPPERARERYFVRYLALVGVVVGIAYGIARWGPSVRWWLPLGALAVVPIAAHCKWSHLGYALTDEHAITRKGFWIQSTKIVPYRRVQTVIQTETILQRRRRLATLIVDTAGSQSLAFNASRAIDVDADVAARLREAVADRLQDAIGRGRQDASPSTPDVDVDEEGTVECEGESVVDPPTTD